MTPYEALNMSYNDYYRQLESKYLGKDVTLTQGKFKGRRARIDGVYVMPKLQTKDKKWYFVAMFAIHPYFIKKPGVDNFSSEARRFKYLPEFELLA